MSIKKSTNSYVLKYEKLAKLLDKLDNNGINMPSFTEGFVLLNIFENKYRKSVDKPNLLVVLSTLWEGLMLLLIIF